MQYQWPPPHPVALWIRVTVTLVLVGGIALLGARGGAPSALKKFWVRLVFWLLLIGIQAAWLWYLASL